MTLIYAGAQVLRTKRVFHAFIDASLPEKLIAGEEPLMVIGAVAGG